MNNERKNKLIEFSGTLAIQMNDLSILDNALTHTSYAHEVKHCESNERIEFLGDSVLGLVVSTFLYKEYPNLSEGELSKLRASIVCEGSLAKLARTISLGEYILFGRGEMLSGGKNRDSILADAFEAIIGAYYLDNGFVGTEKMLLKLLKLDSVDLTKHSIFTDYKTNLQELVQRDSESTIRYKLIAESGPAHDKIFEVAVDINNVAMGFGSARTKKEAEQRAAKEALIQLESKNSQS